MHYTVYKITNELDGKIYIGVHKTKDIDDGYMGSGLHLKRAQDKHGIENFTKEILKVFSNSEEMFNMESVLVNESFVKDSETYNLKVGGEGGFDYINQNGKRVIRTGKAVTEAAIAGRLNKLKTDTDFKEFFGNQVSKGMKRFFEEGGKNSMYGKKHTEETLEKMKEGHKGKHIGEKNSQFGTIWIYSLEEKLSKKITKDELQNHIDDGWLKGRKMKF